MTTNAELKEQQRRQWGGSAASWDALHDNLEREMRPVTDWLCREARLAPGMRMIDFACGSGHPSLTAARLVSPGGSIVATDLAQEMVDVTARRAKDAGLENVEVRVMDLEAIDFPDESFDAATCRFGVMFCPEPVKALREVRRVLRSGGRFAFSVWDEPEKSVVTSLGTRVLARVGKPQAAVDFNAPGVFQLAPSGKLEALLRDAGFNNVRIEPLPLIWHHDSFEDYWREFSQRSVPVRAFLQEASADQAAQLKTALAEEIEPYIRDGRVELPAQPLCAVGEK